MNGVRVIRMAVLPLAVPAISFVVLSLSVFPVLAAGPSFNCSRASLPDERAICASTELSELEYRMAASYKSFKDENPDQARQLARSFLQQRRKCMDNLACIRDVLSAATQTYQNQVDVAVEPKSSDAQSIEDFCLKKWDSDPDFSNSKYKQCIVNASEAFFKQLGDRLCTANSCFFRLTEAQVDGIGGGESVYQGLGYYLRYKVTDSGREILILDPQGELSVFGQCGTCNGMDYGSGPLTSALVRSDGRDRVLELAKTQIKNAIPN
jgi:uncharacterized protein